MWLRSTCRSRKSPDVGPPLIRTGGRFLVPPPDNDGHRLDDYRENGVIVITVVLMIMRTVLMWWCCCWCSWWCFTIVEYPALLPQLTVDLSSQGKENQERDFPHFIHFCAQHRLNNIATSENGILCFNCWSRSYQHSFPLQRSNRQRSQNPKFQHILLPQKSYQGIEQRNCTILLDTAVRALVWNNGTLLCKIDFNRNLSF